ncbi:MAG: N-acetyltransferase [Bacteroidales bacterium]|nr:N-acetyltransferase [Bacteroidales bacterium]
MPRGGKIIREATAADLDGIMPVLEAAKGIMRSDGNMCQWSDGYPTREVILADIHKSGGFVLEEEGQVVGYFAFLPSPEPTYSHIDGGKWLDDTTPYHVIHRIASYPGVHGVFSDIMEFCLSRDPNIRIDTHRDNSIMRHNISKHGFTYCGIIYLESGDERLAYQKLINTNQ